jgi:hypothetical protein
VPSLKSQGAEIWWPGLSSGDYAALGVTEPFQLDWHIDLAGDRIARLRMVEKKLAIPPGPPAGSIPIGAVGKNLLHSGTRRL